MKTEILIDHRVWKRWHPDNTQHTETAISKLNELLKPHGVKVEKTTGPFDGFHRHGKCWKFRFRKDRYFSGKLIWFSFWRFFLTIDKR